MAEKARRAGIALSYNGENMTKQLKGYTESFQYTDIASGESDSIEMTLDNSDMRFFRTNMPKKGDKIAASIQLNNWTKKGETKAFKCGRFILDDLSFSEPPLVCEIGAVALPVKGEFKNRKRTKTYKDATVQEIASSIAKRAGVKLHYEADTQRATEQPFA